LPWLLYRLTQAVIHAWFMARLGTYIQRPALALLTPAHSKDEVKRAHKS
jgi:hypothetical protein